MINVLEICVDDAGGLEAAIAGGADRIELCAALDSGGLTPSFGLMRLAGSKGLPVNALIRPRAGDFIYSPAEIDILKEDITAARNAGLAGVVIGVSQPDGRLDRTVLEKLVEAAYGMDLTLHRAFDLVPDLDEALELAVSLGFSRILTSGGARHAEAGLDALKRLAARAQGRISIMPGGGVRPENAARFFSISGISELHASCSEPAAGCQRLAEFGFETQKPRRTDANTVYRLRREMMHLRPEIRG